MRRRGRGRGGPAAATTAHGEGNVLVSDKAPGPELELAKLSRRLWPRILETLPDPGAVEWEPKGGIVVATTGEAAEPLREFAESQRAAGVNAEELDAAALAQAEPHLTRDCAAAVHYPEDAQVQPTGAATALLADAVRAGAALHTGREAVGAVTRAGRITGVRTSGGIVEGDAVVNAAGPWSGEVARRLGVRLDVRPRRGEVLVTAPMPPTVFHKVYDADYVGAVGSGAERGHVLGHPRCGWWPRTAVWSIERRDQGAPRPHVLCGEADAGGRERHVLEPDALVLAPGAYDRVLPFPGWDLPGVHTAGAAQALVKGERLVVGDRVLIAGSGPFLLPAAAALLAAGSTVRAVLEANAPATVARGWTRRPWERAARTGKTAELAGYAGSLARHRVPYRMGRAVIGARGDGHVEEAVTARLRPDWSAVPGTERTVAVDALCVTHGFTPRLELPVAAGCGVRDGAFVEVDGDQRTTVPAVLAAGEITGIAGAPAGRAEGLLAGWIAAGGSPDAPELTAVRRHRDRGRVFAARLAAAHPIGAAWPGWLRPETVVCRCEETTYGALRGAADDPARNSGHAIKLATRAGLGPCQARMCGPAVADLLSHPATHDRPIAQPIRLGELARPPVGNTKENAR